ncbi:MAG: hypothetical protein C4527_14490 [Candidatus Omnitrophota bacterium]|jgi:hypothetical protein|nr:MAG: hypothetical protein C4527_14490 [Candidatus Omnitrophota bacterium]
MVVAGDESIKKMVRAIMEKRRELGIPDWGMVPIEQVLHRLNTPPQKTTHNSNAKNTLANQPDSQQNNNENIPDPDSEEYKNPPPLLK